MALAVEDDDLVSGDDVVSDFQQGEWKSIRAVYSVKDCLRSYSQGSTSVGVTSDGGDADRGGFSPILRRPKEAGSPYYARGCSLTTARGG